MTKHTFWTASFQCLAKSLLQPIFENNGKGIYLADQQTFVGQERMTNP